MDDFLSSFLCFLRVLSWRMYYCQNCTQRQAGVSAKAPRPQASRHIPCMALGQNHHSPPWTSAFQRWSPQTPAQQYWVFPTFWGQGQKPMVNKSLRRVCFWSLWRQARFLNRLELRSALHPNPCTTDTVMKLSPGHGSTVTSTLAALSFPSLHQPVCDSWWLWLSSQVSLGVALTLKTRTFRILSFCYMWSVPLTVRKAGGSRDRLLLAHHLGLHLLVNFFSTRLAIPPISVHFSYVSCCSSSLTGPYPSCCPPFYHPTSCHPHLLWPYFPWDVTAPSSPLPPCFGALFLSVMLRYQLNIFL